MMMVMMTTTMMMIDFGDLIRVKSGGREKRSKLPVVVFAGSHGVTVAHQWQCQCMCQCLPVLRRGQLELVAAAAGDGLSVTAESSRFYSSVLPSPIALLI